MTNSELIKELEDICYPKGMNNKRTKQQLSARNHYIVFNYLELRDSESKYSGIICSLKKSFMKRLKFLFTGRI